MKNHLIKAEGYFEKGELANGLMEIEHLLKTAQNDCNALMLKAKIFYKQQKWGDALNALNRILELEPEHEPAKNYKQMVMDIISFWNKDSYNP